MYESLIITAPDFSQWFLPISKCNNLRNPKTYSLSVHLARAGQSPPRAINSVRALYDPRINPLRLFVLCARRWRRAQGHAERENKTLPWGAHKQGNMSGQPQTIKILLLIKYDENWSDITVILQNKTGEEKNRIEWWVLVCPPETQCVSAWILSASMTDSLSLLKYCFTVQRMIEFPSSNLWWTTRCQ